jgi:DNA-3-methyladenine glycosylase II
VTLAKGVAALSERDDRFRGLLLDNGLPPLWGRPEGFATLVKIVLEQQVSLDSAAAAFANLEQAIGSVEPQSFLGIDDVQLKKIGFSRQKAGYCRGIAEQCLAGTLDLGELGALGDEAARTQLQEVRGIGPWTSDVYLLFALGRADIWPSGDRALVVSMAESLSLGEVPSYDYAEQLAAAWRPWRSVAARMLWHAYLRRRGRSLT